MFILISLTPLLLLFWTMDASMRRYYYRDREIKLVTAANVIAGSISPHENLYDAISSEGFDKAIDEKSKEGSFRVLIFDTRGVVVKDSNMSEIGKTLIVPEVITAMRKSRGFSTRNEERAVYAAASILNESSQKLGAVLLISSVQDIYDAISEIQRTLLLLIIVTVIALIALAFGISRLLLEPIRAFLNVVQKISEGRLNERFNVKGRDEFAEIASAFNDMATKLEHSENTREEFVSNVSHELKTPLSSIKVLTESILLEQDVPAEMYTEFLRDINSEIDRMNNIVNDLLQLVKLDQREIPLDMRAVDLNKLAEDVLKRLYPLAEQKNIELIFEAARDVTVLADEMKLNLALSNIIENGIKYTQEDGSVKVIVDADHMNAFVTVRDTGIGIEEDEQEKIFNRFYRVDKTRDRETGGTGLGLAITRSTILLHNGSIRVTSKPNEGSVFVVRLPLYRPM
ncbi:MAG: HAMP domain-containing histidine kinase [Clostridiales bacterium]|nr:HAMP domain-containing histidine kinase [Clostridiales bacterium]